MRLGRQHGQKADILQNRYSNIQAFRCGSDILAARAREAASLGVFITATYDAKRAISHME